MHEHNPETCPACQAEGDWSTTSDTEQWFALHEQLGIIIHIGPGKSPQRVVCQVTRPRAWMPSFPLHKSPIGAA
jgi:hypothetical protein